jgi:hypothetical protein
MIELFYYILVDLVKLDKDPEFQCLLESEPDWHEEAVFIYYII